jgi:C4-dicarboxylate transporter, DctM subunit
MMVLEPLMAVETIGVVGVAALFVLLGCGVPVAWAMGVIGAVGNAVLIGLQPVAAQLNLTVWENGTLFLFIALPMFLLMGQLAFHTGVANDLYDCVHKWLGRMPGGLAVAAVVSNAGYGAVTGNSIAAVATIGPMVMPQFRKYGYNLSLGTGTLASAGTLAVLVPPSTLMIIYGAWTETSVGDLFLAGVLPCAVLALTYCLTLVVMCAMRPALGPRGPIYSWPERLGALKKLLPTLLIMTVVMGGIYGGIMTPPEAGAVGVGGVLLVAAAYRRLSWHAVGASLREASTTSGMVFAILVAGVIFSRFLVQTQVTEQLVASIASWQLSRVNLLLMLLLFYFVLGAALDTFGMLMLSLPFVMPVVIAAGIDKVWFGVFVAVMVELAAVSPPVGITVAVMRGVAPDVSTRDIFRGCYPFLILTIALTLLLIFYPPLALWLPQAVK